MSYSFNLRGSKADVLKKLGEEFDKVVALQPMHEADRKPAQAAAQAFLDVTIPPTETQEYSIGVYGSVNYRDKDVTGANVSVTVNLVAKSSQ